MSEAAITLGLQGRVGRRLRPATLSRQAWAYWLAVVGAASAGLTAGLPFAGWSGGWGRFALLTACASVAQLCSVQLTRNRVFHPAIVFVVAGAMLLSPVQLALMCVVQHIPEWLKHRYAWYIQPFNIANFVLAAGAAAFTAELVQTTAGSRSTRDGLAGIAAVAVFVILNRVLLATMLSLGRQLDLRASGLFRVDDFALEFVLALMAVPFAVLWGIGHGLSLLALAPLVLIHFTQRTAQSLEAASQTIQKQNEQLLTTNELVIERSTAALEALSATVDARDAYTAGHSRRVRDIALAIGRELGLKAGELETLGQAALLHDIGKIAVPDTVLLKDGPLDRSEWLLMRAHPQEGARIIEKLGYLENVVPAIRHHHERLDGQGYPDGLAGDAIPIAARVIHVADALDAMLTRRVYRSARSLEAAMAELERGRGTDFCPECVSALERALALGELGGHAVPGLVESVATS